MEGHEVLHQCSFQNATTRRQGLTDQRCRCICKKIRYLEMGIARFKWQL